MQETVDYPDLKTVESLHKEVHNGIKQMIGMSAKQRKSDEGKKALADFKAKCDQFVDLLEGLELQIKQKK